MSLYSKEPRNLQTLDKGLCHVPSVHEYECRSMCLDEFLDAIDVVVEDFLDGG